MKNILLVAFVVIVCFWGCAKCCAWSAKKEAEALESCKLVHSSEQCEAWAARGY